MIFGLFCTLFVLVAFAGVFKETIRQKILPPEQRFNGPVPPPIAKEDIVVVGKEWPIDAVEIATVLQKRYPYYQALTPDLQKRFVSRSLRFLQTKVFIIKSDSGFREMPILTTAAAVQLTFGFRDFLLPWFRYIQIYPEEFLSQQAFKILAGNVSNRTISVAWNHLLQGNECTDDGCNVALHEMSHALYYQKIEVEGLDAYAFGETFNRLLVFCHKAYQQELNGRYDLYSDYATTNLQEFWAESVELFFEKSAALKQTYPDVFNELSSLLKQDPMNKQEPVSGIGFKGFFS